jgi:hypothetical protein
MAEYCSIHVWEDLGDLPRKTDSCIPSRRTRRAVANSSVPTALANQIAQITVATAPTANVDTTCDFIHFKTTTRQRHSQQQKMCMKTNSLSLNDFKDFIE